MKDLIPLLQTAIAHGQMAILWRRARLIRRAIALAVAAGRRTEPPVLSLR